MLQIDKAILDTDQVICKNIDRFDDSERGLLCQNILSQLRNFVEYIADKVYAKGADVDPNDYDLNVNALKYLKTRGDLQFLYKFHDLLQKSVSHYTLDEDGSERLMLKYYEYLLKIKIYMKNTYGLEVLSNIADFPLDTDTELMDYYTKIAEKICNPSKYCPRSSYDDRYYIQKIKPFFVNQEIYYEVTFSTANDKTSKFDRVIAFTKYEILGNYAVKLSIYNDTIDILGKEMNIQVIDNWSVSIRPCEIDNFADIFGNHSKIVAGTNEYTELMRFLTSVRMSLSDLVESSDKYYNHIKMTITGQSRARHIFNILDKCRDLVLQNSAGANIVRYLLYRMNNKIIKSQRRGGTCELLSNLYLDFGCIPFDKMPFCSSLMSHNPKIYDLFDCIPSDEREHELLARHIKNNTEIKGQLFTLRKEILGFSDIDTLVRIYNKKLYYKHTHRKLVLYNDYVYIKGYADDSAYIINKLKELSLAGVAQYTSSVDSWLNQRAYNIDSEEKKNALRQMFASSCVALIYGAAGTGKSTLINHVSNFFADQKKFFLANTHPAVDNMRRKINVGKSEFSTIASFKSDKNNNTECDILIIDECSTVSNADMRKVLEKAHFKLLVLVGDVYQIESIYFGNWFSIAKNFVADTSIFELTHPYRTENQNLLMVWDRVRGLDRGILEPLVKHGYSSKLDESIFSHVEKDEIILCLNYDGLYGINNINRFLQNSNPNPPVQWGINIYKIDDPVLFNESDRFAPLIHNNSKGRIVDICVEEMQIQFSIELDCSINGMVVEGYDFVLTGESENGNSIISFSVNKYRSTDEDGDYSETVVPFQVAYAVSIHKAQGLEYQSVKIVITNEVEERITHNIFYTAITRAKEKLKIYWSPETENSVLSKLSLKDSKRDAYLLSQLYSF